MKRFLKIIQHNENATLNTIQSLLYDQAITLLQTLQVISKKLLLPFFDKVLFKDLLKVFFTFIKIRVGDVPPAFTQMDQDSHANLVHCVQTSCLGSVLVTAVREHF